MTTFYCGKCGRKLSRDLPSLSCCGTRMHVVPEKLPSLAKRAVNLARDTVKHVAGGRLVVDDQTRDWRLKQCQDCPFFKGEICTHKRCGCAMKGRRGFLDALGWASKLCPIGRWNDPPPPWITTAQLTADTLAMVPQLPRDIAGIIGVARSGMVPATLLAMQLHRPLYSLRQREGDIVPVGHGYRLEPRPNDGPLLLVDDSYASGQTLKRSRGILERAGVANYKTLSVYVTQTKPVDYWFRLLKCPHLFEWNFFNSIWVPDSAFDFDGILCHDGYPDQPLNLPRRCPVPLIVTARPEAERAKSLAWLAAQGVRVNRLEMWPGRPAERNQPLAISAYKAKHFAASGLRWFVESCPIQAAEIAQLAKKPVICPPAAKVFG